jgi:hypothetical protein
MDKTNMASIIVKMLANACILSIILLAFKRKDRRLFCTAWVLSGSMDIYWGIASVFHYSSMLSHVHPRGESVKIVSAYCQCLLGSILVISSYFLYKGKGWAYQFIRVYCYFVGISFIVFCSVGILIILYLIYAKNAIIPGLQRLPGTCDLLILIGIIIYSIKFLDTIRPEIIKKPKKEELIIEKEKEEIACPECGNIIPADKNICSKCNWTYADNKGNQ